MEEEEEASSGLPSGLPRVGDDDYYSTLAEYNRYQTTWCEHEELQFLSYLLGGMVCIVVRLSCIDHAGR